MNKLRMAVIGAGAWAGSTPRSSPSATTSNWWPSSIRCRPTAIGWPPSATPKPWPTIAGLLDQLDAAVIAAPTSLHHRIAREFLEAGVHLLVEKPLCATRAEADELVAAARRRKVVLQVGHVERFNPAFRAAAPHVAQSQVHRGRSRQRLHLPLDRRGRGAGPDDPRHRPGAVAGPQPAAQGRRPGDFGARRPRRRGQRPAGVRVRLRGHALGVARQLRAGAADAGLVGRGRLPASTSPPAPRRWSAPAKRSCGGSSTSTR